MTSFKFIVTLDGGAASGKSSTARGVAERFGLLHVDTGSHYRALTWHLLKLNLQASEVQHVEQELSKLSLGTQIQARRSLMTLDDCILGEEALKSAPVNASVSGFAALPAVRDKLRNYQRSQYGMALEKGFPGIIMEGRDIGSVIFPDAPLRYFLEADPEARQMRRKAEGWNDAVRDRDRSDASRATAPLKVPEGATRLDTTSMPLDAVVNWISNDIRLKLPSLSTHHA